MTENIKICNACFIIIPESSEHRHVVSNIDMVQEFTPLTTLEKVEKQRDDLLEAAKEVNRYFNESRYNQYGDTTESYTNAYNKLEEAISRATEEG